MVDTRDQARFRFPLSGFLCPIPKFSRASDRPLIAPSPSTTLLSSLGSAPPPQNPLAHTCSGHTPFKTPPILVHIASCGSSHQQPRKQPSHIHFLLHESKLPRRGRQGHAGSHGLVAANPEQSWWCDMLPPSVLIEPASIGMAFARQWRVCTPKIIWQWDWPE